MITLIKVFCSYTKSCKIGDLNQSILGSKVILCSSQKSKNIKDRILEERQQNSRGVTFPRAVLEKRAQPQKKGKWRKRWRKSVKMYLLSKIRTRLDPFSKAFLILLFPLPFSHDFSSQGSQFTLQDDSTIPLPSASVAGMAVAIPSKAFQ